MKSSRHSAFMIVWVALIVWGCKPDDPFVLKGVGTWNIARSNIKNYENGSLAHDQTRIDSLGQLVFERSGRGYIVHADAQRDTITWEESLPQQRLVMYPKIGQFMNAAISDRTDNSMTLFWVNEGDEGTLHLRIETTLMIVRD